MNALPGSWSAWSLVPDGAAAAPAGVILSLGVVTLARPASVLTNLLLAGQCAWMAGRIREGAWRSFFAWVALGAFLGAFKHGFHHVTPDALHQGLAATSNVALGFAVASAQAASLPERTVLPRLQTLLVLVVNLWTRSFGATGVLLLAGMLPVVGRSLGLGAPARPRLALAWAVCGGAGGAWAVGWTPAPWFDQTDLAHLVLLAGLAGVFAAVRDSSPGDRFDDSGVLVQAPPSPSRLDAGLPAFGGAEEHPWN